jgi:signal transduction histidine kinase
VFDRRNKTSEDPSGGKPMSGHEAQMRSLASKLIMLETRTRRSIANDLHNNVGQRLFLIGMAFHDLQQMKSHHETKNQIDKITNLINQAFNETHNLIYRTYPPVLALLGLGAAIREFADDIEKDYGVAVRVCEKNQPLLLPEDLNDLLYQMVKKLLINVVQHIPDHCPTVSIIHLEHEIRIEIQTAGTGLDKCHLPLNGYHDSGFGLLELRERLTFLGGSIELIERAEPGATAIISAPVSEPPPAET